VSNNEAITHYTAAFLPYVKNPRSCLDRFVARASEGNRFRGIVRLTDAVRRHPGSPLAYQAQEFAYCRNGFYDNAIEDFSQAIRWIRKKHIRATTARARRTT